MKGMKKISSIPFIPVQLFFYFMISFAIVWSCMFDVPS